MQKNFPFSYHAKGVTETILADIASLSRPVQKFLSTVFSQWWAVVGRYNFMNMSRFMNYSEQALRNGFARGFEFSQFNRQLLSRYCSKEIFWAFDPTHIAKSGKRTHGLDYFFSGKEQRVKKGLELGCLAGIDVKNKTGFHLAAVQTPSSSERKKKKQSLITHYRGFIFSQIGMLKAISNCLVVDGYFMKKQFILPLAKAGMTLITKMRSDANVKYLHTGKQKKGRGRKRKLGEKVNWKNLQMDKWTKIFSDQEESVYTAVLYCVMLKMNVRIVLVQNKKTGSYEILLCTDINMDAKKIERYYRLRFQIEFLIRDAKQYSGLEHCQARDKNKLHFHFNLSLTNVSIAKAQYYLSKPRRERGAFSLQDIKRMHYNRLIADFILENLGADLKCKKIKKLYADCANFGKLAA
jgi:hypothetical protein